MPHRPIAALCVACQLACAVLAAPALADAPPLTLPTRDVDVRYEILRPNAPADQEPLTQRIRWTAADRELRLDTASPGLYVVMDYQRHLLSAIRPQQRLALQVPSDGAMMVPGTARSGNDYVKRGEDVVAGLPCVDWQTRDATGGITIVCLTADGVMLRAIVGQSALVQATSVTFGPLDAALFAIPAGYRRIEAPPGAAAPPAPGPRP